jgi:hypothetical protein
MQNLLFSPHILIYWEHFCQLFYFKLPTLVNSILFDAPFPKYSTSKMIPLLASISQKFLHLRENFRIFAKISRKWNFHGNWILTLPHICLFILLKWDVMTNNNTTCIMHAVLLKNLMDFSFSQKFSWDFRINFRETKFRKNRPIFTWFSHFRENLKVQFRFNPRCHTNWCLGPHLRTPNPRFNPEFTPHIFYIRRVWTPGSTRGLASWAHISRQF